LHTLYESDIEVEWEYYFLNFLNGNESGNVWGA